MWVGVGAVTAAGLVMALVGAGCATSGTVAGASSYTDSPYVIIEDATLASQVTVVGVEHQMVGELMKAHVTIRSNRHRSLMLRYKVSWYDESGVEIDPGSKPYRTAVLPGKDSLSITSMAPNPSAKEFKFRLEKVKAIKIENIK